MWQLLLITYCSADCRLSFHFYRFSLAAFLTIMWKRHFVCSDNEDNNVCNIRLTLFIIFHKVLDFGDTGQLLGCEQGLLLHLNRFYRLSEWVSELGLTSHSQRRVFPHINFTGTDNQKQWNKTSHTSETHKTNMS